MEVIQFGNFEDRIDLRRTLSISNNEFILFEGHIDPHYTNAKVFHHFSKRDLIAIEHQHTFLTLHFTNAKGNADQICIHDLSVVVFAHAPEVIDLDVLFEVLGKSFFLQTEFRKETIIEALLDAMFWALPIILSLAFMYIIWFDTNLLSDTALHGKRTLMKSLLLFTVGKLVALIGYDLSGGLFVLIMTYSVWMILKRIMNKKTIKIYRT
jgi:hypothetical protein